MTLLAVLDYAARARKAVPAYTPRETHRLSAAGLCSDGSTGGVRANERGTPNRPRVAARQTSAAREYAARMTQAPSSASGQEETRRQQAMADAGVTETPEEAKRAQRRAWRRASRSTSASVVARCSEEAGLGPDGKTVEEEGQ